MALRRLSLEHLTDQHVIGEGMQLGTEMTGARLDCDPDRTTSSHPSLGGGCSEGGRDL